MRYAPGTTATLTATIAKSDGTPINPTSILVDIYDGDGTLVVDDQVPTQISTGLYEFDYDIAEDADKGLWRIEWRLVVQGAASVGVEYFEVYELGDPAPEEANVIINTLLRSRWAELKTDPLGDGSDTMFTDSQIAMIYELSGQSVDKSTLEGWRWKMARYAQLVDITESGSDRKMSQKFKQAKEMVDWWRRFIGDTEADDAAAMAGRVVGRVVNLRGTGKLCLDNPYPFSGYSEHIRLFPTHRLIIPAILS